MRRPPLSTGLHGRTSPRFRVMKIVHAASELYPYVKTGGLADAVGSLASTLADKGHDVAVFVPGYRAALDHKDVARAEQRLGLRVEMGDRIWPATSACCR